ncbi:hypothetical protein HDU97_005095 [Phlyctochytrium planicorne]|nr:hypothetical protein HDU97_005095 [Phlyctochytrium planicorne]
MDNTVKLWVVEKDAKQLRLWKSRQGHYKPPSRIRFSDDGLSIFSISADNTFRNFSLVNDARSHIFSAGDTMESMAQLTHFSCNDAKKRFWDSAMTCHANDSLVRLWSVKNKRLGKHLLGTTDKSFAKVCLVSYCGNFGFIGTSSGRTDMFNLQSGLHRKTFAGHRKPVVGLGSSLNNHTLISVSLDGEIKFWDIHSGRQKFSIQLPSAVSCIEFHRETELLAVACDDLSIRIIDTQSFEIVRVFWGHMNRILDLTFSPDSRWLLSTGMDSCLRTWDLPLGTCIETMKLPHIATSVTFSPIGNFIATSHVNHNGLYLWSNSSLYSSIPNDRAVSHSEISSMLPVMYDSKPTLSTGEEKVAEISELPSIEALHAEEEDELIKLSTAELTRLHLVLNKEASQKRSKPKLSKPPAAAAPFFLFGTPNEGPAHETKIKRNPILSSSSELEHILETQADKEDFDILTVLNGLSPAKLEIDISLLPPSHLIKLLKCISKRIQSNGDFDLIQLYLSLSLKIHGEVLAELDDEDRSEAKDVLVKIEKAVEKVWSNVEETYFYVAAGLPACNAPITELDEDTIILELPSKEKSGDTCRLCQKRLGLHSVACDCDFVAHATCLAERFIEMEGAKGRQLIPQQGDFGDINHFRSILASSGAAAVITDEDETKAYNEDWMRKYRGQSRLVLRPKTTIEVSDILKHCNERKLAVVPQGGNTGLVGGSVPVFDEVVVSTSSMNSIEGFDEVSGIVTCQAGCILEVLDGWLGERGYMMPLDLGAKGTCQIGGNVATNAGGLRLLRYGSLHGTVLSLEVVLPDGRIVNLGQPLRKDNTGFDLKQLFIGSEGSLGIITKVSILTPRRSSSVNVAVLRVSSYNAVQKVFLKAKSELSEILSAFEFWDSDCSQLVLAYIDGARPLLTSPPSDPHFYVLLETSGSNDAHDSEKVMEFLNNVLEDGTVEDGALAENVSQRSAFWSFRESIPEACARDGKGGNLKYDLSVPVPVLYDVVVDLRERLKKLGVADRMGRVVGFGHMGDGNLHLNITGTGWDADVAKGVEPFVYEWTEKNHGSISAEHGLGVMKAPYIGYSKSREAVGMMKELKRLWDPNGIMNPYKFLPA